MAVRRSANAYKEHPCKDSSEASFFADAHALSALYERFRRPLHSYIYRLLGSQEDADDVTQEVDLLRRRKRISWWSLTSHTCGDEGFFLPPDDGGIAEIAEREHIRLAIANMPEDYAAALVLNVVQGVPYQEVAAVVGISPGAAAIRISRAKKMFVEQYQRISRSF